MYTMQRIKQEPGTEPVPSTSDDNDIGFTADDLLSQYRLDIPSSRSSRIFIPAPTSVKEEPRWDEPDTKRTKAERANEVDPVEEELFVKRINAQEKEKATAFMFRPYARDEVKMEVDNDTASTGFTLDNVSTCLGEVDSLLDPEYRNTVEHYFNAAKKTDYNESKLPILDHHDTIVSQIRINRVVVINGSTGCGKTTQVPQYIMEDCFKFNKHFNIVVTQPRRIAAKSVSERVCFERGWEIGELVGFQIGMEKRTSELTRLTYCTTGVLLQQLITRKKMDNYTHIIIDEIHERSDETDLLLMVVRKFLWTQSAPVKVILMSATFDTSKFIKYFTLESADGRPMRPFEIRIDQHPKKIIKSYIESIPGPYIEEACGTSVDPSELYDFKFEEPCINVIRGRLCPVMIKGFDDVEKSTRKGAVLVFLPGLDDIRSMTNMLQSYASRKNLNWLIIPLHSSITLEEQKKAFNASKIGERKIILSTNIAESSITVPEVVYVIDYCLTKNLVCDRITNYPTLKLEWASHANCDQRAGRCGRVSDGRVYRMVPTQFYECTMRKEGVPELLRTPLENSILKVKKLDLGSPYELLSLCIDYPPLRDLRRSIIRLKRVGALTPTLNGEYNEADGQLTLLGKMMADLPLDVQLSKFVMMGYLFDCLDDCIIIAACLSLQNFFSKSFDDTIRAYKARLAWAERSFSDPIAYWYAYRTFQDMVTAGMFAAKSPKAELWCKRNFIQFNRLKDVMNLVEELRKRLQQVGILQENRPNLVRDKFEDQLVLKVVIAGAFYPYYYLQCSIIERNPTRDLLERDLFGTVKISGLPRNEGVLYTDQIKKALAEIDAPMDFEYHDSHCYVTFHDTEEEVLIQAYAAQTDGLTSMPRADDQIYQESELRRKVFQENRVKLSVYLAVKLARCGQSIIITKYKPAISTKRIKILEDQRKEKETMSHMLTAIRFIVPAYTSCQIAKPRLPSKATKKIYIRVTEVNADGTFFAVYNNESTLLMQETLQRAIDEAYQPQAYPYNNPRVGDFILIAWEDRKNEYSRARVTRVERDRKRFEVFAIDIGSVATINFESLSSCVRLNQSAMPTDLFSIPALAMHCRLCEVRPAPGRSMRQESRYNDLNYFASLVDDRDDLWAMVYSVVNETVALKMFRLEDKGISLNDRLVTEGLFVQINEDPPSKSDCYMRLRTPPNDIQEPLYTHYETCSVNPTFEENEEKYLNGDCRHVFKSPFTKETVRLRGPYTPIEVDFAGVTHQDSRLRVHVDSESVNSVCFDPDPENSNRRLLVSACVHLQQEGGRLTARNTTLMPDIAGFPQLMALLFSPRAELRLDVDGCRYLGALCGLGFDKETKVAYDPEHDMELPFDCFIDNKDLVDINIIRYNISDILSSEAAFSEISGHALFLKQQKIRSNILSLLSRNRVTLPIKAQWDRSFEWVESKLATHQDDLNEVLYAPHPVDAQVDLDAYRERIADNLLIMKGMFATRMRSAISCEICGREHHKFFTSTQLSAHLATDEHVALVKRLFEPARWSEFQVLDEFNNSRN